MTKFCVFTVTWKGATPNFSPMPQLSPKNETKTPCFRTHVILYDFNILIKHYTFLKAKQKTVIEKIICYQTNP